MRETQGLRVLAEGTRDIAVCASGFGSAWMGPDRWRLVHELTGYTTMTVVYSAQILPRVDANPIDYLSRLYARFHAARAAALRAGAFLASWIDRWVRQGRRVLLVGFSLGGALVYEAARRARGRVDVVAICAAYPDEARSWDGLEQAGAICNAYSTADTALRFLYPLAAGDILAAGTRPVLVGRPQTVNLDLTPLVGGDHVALSRDLEPALRLSLAALYGGRELFEPPPPPDLAGLHRAAPSAPWSLLEHDLELRPWVRSAVAGESAASSDWAHRVSPWLREHQAPLLSLSKGYAELASLDSEVAALGALELLGLGRIWLLRDGMAPHTEGAAP